MSTSFPSAKLSSPVENSQHAELHALRARNAALEDKLAQIHLLMNEGLQTYAHNRVLEEKVQRMHLLMREGLHAYEEDGGALRNSVERMQHIVDKHTAALRRNLAEKERVKSHLANIYESLPLGVLVTDAQGRISGANPAAQRMLKQPLPALRGQSIQALLGLPQLRLTAHAGGPEASWEGRTGREATEARFAYLRADNETLQILATTAPLRNQNSVVGYLVHLQDITRLEQLEAQAQRRNRLTAMGEMAARIAHEIRNPLCSIELFASLARRRLREDPECHAFMEHIATGVASMNHVLANLLEYTRPHRLSLHNLELGALLRQEIAFHKPLAESRGVQIHAQLPQDALPLRADAELLRQALRNLIRNGIQALHTGGHVTLSACRNANDVEIVVADNGCGFPPEHATRIFDPFYTTKSSGTGLGLAIVHTILEAHHANVEAHSVPGRGSRFLLRLPITPPEPPTHAAEQKRLASPEVPTAEPSPAPLLSLVGP